MSKKVSKSELQLLYQVRYGNEALKSSLYFGYSKRDYEAAIEAYDLLERKYDEVLYERVKVGRTLKEREKLKTLNNFI